MDHSLPQLVAEVSELLRNSRSMENKRETIFELLRRACLKSAKEESLEVPSITEAGIEDVWLFLLKLRKTSPVRKRRVDECLNALIASERWTGVLHQSSRLLEVLMESDPEVQSKLSPESVTRARSTSQTETLDPPGIVEPEKVPMSTSVPGPQGGAMNPFGPAKAKASNPFARFEKMSPKARAGSMAFSAAFEEKDRTETKVMGEVEKTNGENDRLANGEPGSQTQTQFLNMAKGACSAAGQGAMTAAKKTMEFEQKHHLTQRAAQATMSSVEAVREANQKYGVTQKIGQGVSTAVTRTKEFEQEHQVSSRAMNAARASVAAARDVNQKYGVTEKIGQGASAAYSKATTVASGLKSGSASKNPFASAPQAPAVPANSGNPFRS